MSENDEAIAVLGGGCFWCLEAVFQEVKGVREVRSGYAGGQVDDPTYRQVCSGTTGHAEVVRVAFDPSQVSYRQILEVFFTIHDPTTPNRQGADVGPQYRSAIFHTDEEQARTARALVEELDGSELWDDPIVTEVAPLETFYPAEPAHDDYYRRNRYQPYCQAVISPKLSRFRRRFRETLMKDPA